MDDKRYNRQFPDFREMLKINREVAEYLARPREQRMPQWMGNCLVETADATEEEIKAFHSLGMD